MSPGERNRLLNGSFLLGNMLALHSFLIVVLKLEKRGGDFEYLRSHFDSTRLAYLTLDDFIYCANEMIQNWTYGMQGKSTASRGGAQTFLTHTHVVHEQTGEPGIDLDRQFLHFLADLKGELGDKDVLEQYRKCVEFAHYKSSLILFFFSSAMKPLLVEAIPGSQFRLMDTNVKVRFIQIVKKPSFHLVLAVLFQNPSKDWRGPRPQQRPKRFFLRHS